jgi:hypothetical protein
VNKLSFYRSRRNDARANFTAQSKRKKIRKLKPRTAPAEKKPEVTIKEYSKVITKEAVSDQGLFIVHKVTRF